MDVSVLGGNSPIQRGDTTLQYRAERNATGIKINYDLGYFRTFEQGGPISPLNYITPSYCGFRWDFPVLDLKFLNSRSETLFLTEVIFEVDESTLDQSAFFAIQQDTQQSLAGCLILRNEGHSELTNLSLAFHLLPGMVAEPRDLEGPYPHRVDIPVLQDRAEVDVLDAFEAEGADINGLILLGDAVWEPNEVFSVPTAAGTTEKLSPAEMEERAKKYRGPFEKAVGTLVGRIAFRDPGAKDAERSVKFYAYVFIENKNRKSLPRPPTFSYDTVFDSDNLNYRRAFSISHELRPGEADRVTVKIAVPTSSVHHFRVTVRDISGLMLQSPPIELRCFVPRSRQQAVANKVVAR